MVIRLHFSSMMTFQCDMCVFYLICDNDNNHKTTDRTYIILNEIKSLMEWKKCAKYWYEHFWLRYLKLRCIQKFSKTKLIGNLLQGFSKKKWKDKCWRHRKKVLLLCANLCRVYSNTFQYDLYKVTYVKSLYNRQSSCLKTHYSQNKDKLFRKKIPYVTQKLLKRYTK